MWVVTITVTTVIADLIAGFLKSIVQSVAKHYNIPEDDAKVVVTNKLIDVAALVGVGTGALYSKLGVKAVDYLGIKGATAAKRALSASAATKVAATDANAAASIGLGKKMWSALAAFPATQVLMFVMIGQNIGDWYFFKTGLFIQTVNGIFGNGTVAAPDTSSGATGFSKPDFIAYAAAVEAQGVAAISAPSAKILAQYSRDDLAKLLTWLYGQQLLAGLSTGNKAVEAAAQPYLIMQPKSGQYAASLYDQVAQAQSPSPSVSSAPVAKATVSVSKATTTSAPKIFTGVISQGTLGAATSFAPRPDDLISSLSELESAAANNLAPFIASLPGRIKYEIKIVSSVTGSDGFTQRGTTQRIQIDTFANGQPKYKTVTNRFAVMTLYIVNKSGGKTKLADITLGPTDAVNFQPAASDIGVVESFLQSNVHTSDISSIANVVPASPAAATSSTPATQVSQDSTAQNGAGATQTSDAIQYTGSSSAASASIPVNPTDAQLAARLNPQAYSFTVPTQGLFAAQGDFGTTIYKRVGNRISQYYMLGAELVDNWGQVIGAGNQASIAVKNLKERYGIDWAALPQFLIGNFEKDTTLERVTGYGANGEYTQVIFPISTLSAFLGLGWNQAAGSYGVTLNNGVATISTAAATASTASSPQTLTAYYAARGLPLPSVAERAKVYASLGLGAESYYTGTAEQNVKLLAALKIQ